MTQRGALVKDDDGHSVGWNYKNITTLTTTVVKIGPGILHAVVINDSTSTGVIKIYDNTTATGTVIATITSTGNISPDEIAYNLSFNTGLTIVTSVAAQDITIMYV